MNIGSVSGEFILKGLQESINNLVKAQTELGKIDKALVTSKATVTSYANSWKTVDSSIMQTIKDAKSAKDAIDRLAAAQRNAQATMGAVRSGLAKGKEEAGWKRADARAKTLGAPFGGLGNIDISSKTLDNLNKASSTLSSMIEKSQKFGETLQRHLTPSKQIQNYFSNLWNTFGRVALGFGVFYRLLQAVSAAANYVFTIFAGGIKTMDDVRSSGAMVAGMLALVAKNGQDYATNYKMYFEEFQQVIRRTMVLLPKYGLTMQQFTAATRELAQFGVKVDNKNLEKSIVSMKLIQEIASNTSGDTRQLRQEIQAFFNGQARMSDQFAKMLNTAMPGLAKEMEKIKASGGTTQQMWAKLTDTMYKMKPSLEAANATLETQHTILKASLSVISGMALEATGLYDIWLNGLKNFNESLFKSDGALTEFGLKIYKVFFKAWEWTKEWGKVLFGVGQILYAVLIKPFLTLFNVLVGLKSSFIELANTTLTAFFDIYDALKEKDLSKAFDIFKTMREANKGTSKKFMESIGLDIVDGFVEQGQLIIKGMQNTTLGFAGVMKDDYIDPSLAKQKKIKDSLDAMLTIGGNKEGKEREDKLKSHLSRMGNIVQEFYDWLIQLINENEKFGLGEFDVQLLDVSNKDKENQLKLMEFSNALREKAKHDPRGIVVGMADAQARIDAAAKVLEINRTNAITDINYQKDLKNYLNTETGIREQLVDLDSRREWFLINQDTYTKAQLGIQQQLLDLANKRLEIATLANNDEDRRAALQDILNLTREMNKGQMELFKTNATMWQGFTFGLVSYKESLKKEFDQIAEFGESFAQSMENVFSSVFEDALNGELKKASDYFEAFRRSFTKMLADLTTQLIMMQMMTGANKWWGALMSGASGFNADSTNTGLGGGTHIPLPGSTPTNSSAYGYASPSMLRGAASIEKAPAGVSVNVINQSSQPVTASQGEVKFDGEKYIVDVVMKNLHTNPGFRNALGRTS